MISEECEKARVLKAQATLKFICQHPDGVTFEDFKKAGIIPSGLDRLQRLGVIEGIQLRKPEEVGTRHFRWLWKARKR